MPEPIEESLGFDISPALQGIAQIDDALAQVTQTFAVGLATALETLTGVSVDLAQQVDTSGLSSSIEGAIQDAGNAAPVTVDGDTEALTGAIDQAVGVTADVPVDGDTTGLSASIDDATAVVPVVAVDADVSAAENAIGSLQGEDVAISVDADTSGAEDAISSLGDAANQTTGNSGAGIGGLEAAVGGLEAATGAAKGNVSGLTSEVGGLSVGLGAAVAGGTAFAAFIGETINLAADAEAQQKRFNDTFGASADLFNHISVGGLNTSLQDLGKTSGTTEANLDAAATKVGLIGTSAGASQPEVASMASSILALGGTFAVANPRLGDAADVANRLTQAFVTGRTRALVPYGISLTQAQITAEALRQTQKQSATDLTGYDKLVAGVTLVLAQQGDTLGTKYAEGAKNAQVQLRALKVEFEESLVAIGQPLLKPAVDSLQAIIPVGIEVGQVLGSLARIILPFVAALAPAVALIAAPLKLVADGLGFVADGVDALSSPELIGIAVAVTAVGVAMGAADGLIVAFGAALDTALGPVGLLVGGLALLGGALDLFGSNGPSAADAAKAIGEELFGASSGAEDLSGQLDKLDTNLKKLTTDFIESQPAGSVVRNAFDTIGGGSAGLQAALTGSQQSFDAYAKSIADATSIHSKIAGPIDVTTKALQAERQAILDSENAQIANLVTAGKATKESVAAAEATVLQKEGYLDLVAVLKLLNTGIDEAAAAQAKVTLSQSIASGALHDAVIAYRPAIDSTSEYTDKLVALGVTQADADQLQKDQTKALADQTDKTILASAAVTQLNVDFLTGKIGAGQLEGGVFALGTTVGAAAGDVSGLTSAIDSFAQSVVSALPNAGSAITQFNSDVTSAFSGVESALKSGDSTVQAAQKTVDSARTALAQATSGANTAADRSAQSAQQTLDNAKARLAALEQGGKASAASIVNATASVANAQAHLNDIISQGGAAGAQSVKNAQQNLDKANADLVAAQGQGSQAVKDAQAKLAAAIDPQALIDKFVAETKAIGDFQKNLAALVSEGLGSLAGELATKGPEVGGALAQAFVNDHTKALAADGAVRQVTAATDAINAYVHGPQVAAQMGANGATIADSINAGVRAHFDLVHPTQDALNAAALIVAAAEPGLTGISQGLARAGVVAFQSEFGRLPTVAEVQAGAAARALAAAGPQVASAALASGGQASDAWTVGVGGIGAGTKAAVGGAAAAFFSPEEKAAASAAAVAGTDIGAIFAFGIAQGMSSVIATKNIVDASTALADAGVAAVRAALGIKSPSTVGIGIGALFVEGITIGLNRDLTPIEKATAALAVALVPNLRPQIHDALDQLDLLKAATELQARTTKIPTLAAQLTSRIPAAVALGAQQLAPGLGGPTSSGFPNREVVRDPAHLVNIEHVTVQKETDPLHIATELAWRLG